MRFRIMRPAVAAMGFVAAAGILAGGLALRPAFAGGSFQVGPNSVVHCTSNSPCQTYSNQGHSIGVEGVNTNSAFSGAGVYGSGTNGGYGVNGYSLNNVGVNGQSTNNAGVSGTNGNGFWGIYGYGSGGAEAVHGQSTDSYGGDFTSVSATGLTGFSESAEGAFILNASSSPALSVLGSTGDGLDAASGNSGGYVLNVSNQAFQAGDGIVSYGYYIGETDRSNSYPWLATDQNNSDLAYLTVGGEMLTHGGYGTFSKTRNGDVTTAFASESTSPTIEDNGTAHMVSGTAVVRLGSAFADTMDTGRAYQVMLTPDGDTRGLYIASKTPTAFVVREVQGGRATLDFDYHIYATKVGSANVHMVEMTPAQVKAFEPKAPMYKVTMPKYVNRDRVVKH
jgi:hypothetical protein